MKKIIGFTIVIMVILFNGTGCIKSTTFGGDILKDDEINIDFVDTFSMVGQSLKNDSVLVYPLIGNNSYMFGSLKNSVIGEATSNIFCDFKATGSKPDTLGIEIDSIVLTMIIDTSAIYGDKGVVHNIRVYELTDYVSLEETDSFYSDRVIDYDLFLLGETSITSRIDSVTVIEPKKDTARYGEQVRIHLDNIWGNKFLLDSNTVRNDTLFKEMFKGLYIESNTNGSSILNLNKIDSGNKHFTKIEVYYTVDGELKKMSFYMDNAFNQFDHDYQTSEVFDYLNISSKGDSFLFIQGMEGIKMEIDISDFSDLKEKNINKAELVFNCVRNEGIAEDLHSRLITRYIDESGNEEYIEDYTLSKIASDSKIYNGYKTEVEENGIKSNKYVINVTLHIKELMDKGIYNTKLFIEPFNRMIEPGFAKIYGVKNENYRPKLRITYSNKD